MFDAGQRWAHSMPPRARHGNHSVATQRRPLQTGRQRRWASSPEADPAVRRGAPLPQSSPAQAPASARQVRPLRATARTGQNDGANVETILRNIEADISRIHPIPSFAQAGFASYNPSDCSGSVGRWAKALPRAWRPLESSVSHPPPLRLSCLGRRMGR